MYSGKENYNLNTQGAPVPCSLCDGIGYYQHRGVNIECPCRQTAKTVVMQPVINNVHVNQRKGVLESAYESTKAFGLGIFDAGKRMVGTFKRNYNGAPCPKCNNTGLKIKNGKVCTCGIRN